MKINDNPETITRGMLYDEIWEMSVKGVARKYALNYGRLMNLCKIESIPYPAAGYWTRKSMGKDVSGEKIALSGEMDKEMSLRSLRSNPVNLGKNQAAKKQPEKEELVEEKAVEIATVINTTDLLFLSDEERRDILIETQKISVAENERLHKSITQYKRRIEEYRKKLNQAQKQDYYNPRMHKPDNEPLLFRQVSVQSLSRAYVLVDALLKSIEKLGGKVNDDISVRIKDDIVRFDIIESQDKTEHELTKNEAKLLVEYNDAVKRGRWASKPQIRKYDKVYNGTLRIVMDNHQYIKDSKNQKLEDRLGDILIMFYEAAEENRIARIKREEEEQRRVEQERIREEQRKNKASEIQRVKALVNCAEDYKIAMEIRAYIEAVIASGAENPDSEWVAWAKRKADWYDPTIAYEDKLLGVREHEKDKEEKDRQLGNSGRTGYGWRW